MFHFCGGHVYVGNDSVVRKGAECRCNDINGGFIIIVIPEYRLFNMIRGLKLKIREYKDAAIFQKSQNFINILKCSGLSKYAVSL